MKKADVPQDKSGLIDFTREVYYVKNEDGKYETELSTGWETKTTALEETWKEINRLTEEAKRKVLAGEVSPIAYYMEEKLMDFNVLCGYTGFWKFQIKNHMKPSVFNKLSDKKLAKYAAAFEISIEQLKNFNP
jgi:hypothetical protein